MNDDSNKQIYRDEAYELLGELETTLLELEQNSEDADLTNRVFRALHTIKGSGAMFGFDDIADFTHEVETVFERVRSGEIPVTKELISLVFMARDHIQVLLDASCDDSEVDVSAVGTILGGLHRLAAGESVELDMALAPGEEPEPEPVEEPAPEAAEESVVEEAAPGSVSEEAAEPGRAQGLRVHFIPKDPSAASDGYDPRSLLDELCKLGSCLIKADASKVPGLDKLDPSALYLGWEVVFSDSVEESSVREVFFFSDLDMDVTVEALDQARVHELKDEWRKAEEELDEAPKKIGELLLESGDVNPEDLEEALAQQKPLGKILTDSGKVSEEAVERAVKKQEEQRKSKAVQVKQEAASSLRVAADKLDSLVDLVGELVIVQARISQLVSERSDPQLTVVSEELERLSDELRDSTLSIRMLPIGTTFAKFRRLVRDLSSDLDKEIELVTEGGETELDKTVLERLGDPLVHLLRNSIDHGLETPGERQEAGKERTGNIVLAAEHSGGEVLIRIEDDGKGINADAIRAKALERGLISPDAELDDKEAFKLIFEPGFSTAKKVTNVSGRGVGMDVVKRAIDSLRGTIDIDSTLGKGTIITIRLPLTLAIIDGLQVQVGNEFFVIPLSLVEECVEHKDREAEVAGRSILDLRGEIVPYVTLRYWFDINGGRPDIEQIVVTGVEGRRVGIVVDHVIGEHQTVIKSLGKVYKDVPGVSGATIKGDGTIALILDVPALVRKVASEAS